MNQAPELPRARTAPAAAQKAPAPQPQQTSTTDLPTAAASPQIPAAPDTPTPAPLRTEARTEGATTPDAETNSDEASNTLASAPAVKAQSATASHAGTKTSRQANNSNARPAASLESAAAGHTRHQTPSAQLPGSVSNAVQTAPNNPTPAPASDPGSAASAVPQITVPAAGAGPQPAFVALQVAPTDLNGSSSAAPLSSSRAASRPAARAADRNSRSETPKSEHNAAAPVIATPVITLPVLNPVPASSAVPSAAPRRGDRESHISGAHAAARNEATVPAPPAAVEVRIRSDGSGTAAAGGVTSTADNAASTQHASSRPNSAASDASASTSAASRPNKDADAQSGRDAREQPAGAPSAPAHTIASSPAQTAAPSVTTAATPTAVAGQASAAQPAATAIPNPAPAAASEPRGHAAPAAPAAPAEPIADAQRNQTQPLRSVSLEFAPDGAPDVRVRLSERGGDVHISLHSADPALAGKFRDGVQDLAGALTNAGYDAEAWARGGGGRERDADEQRQQQQRRPNQNNQSEDFSGMMRQNSQENS